MKRALVLLIALTMVAGLFAACASSSDNTAPSATSGTTTETAAPATAETAEPTEGTSGSLSVDPGEIAPPDNTHEGDTLAVNPDGTLKYQIDAETFYPADWYDYELPLTTGDDTFTYWTMTYTDTAMIPEGGIGEMPYQQMLLDKTGVRIEYQVNPPYEALTMYQIMIASQDISDLVCYASWYWQLGGGGVESDMIDQGFYANIADYRAYAPNFLYQVPRFNYDPDLIKTMWLNDEMITSIGAMSENARPATGWVIRGDWLDRLEGAPKPEDIKTYDQVKDILTRFQTEIIPAGEGYPMAVVAVIELTTGDLFAGMNTEMSVGAPKTKVVNGEVRFTLSEQVDFEALTLLTEWMNLGLIDPEYASYNSINDFSYIVHNDGVGFLVMTPGEVDGYEKNNATPEARWEAVPHPALTENFEWKYAHGLGKWALTNYGWGFAASCENIPLLISYADYFYSPEGAIDGSWGVEGVTYEYNENGVPMVTDLVLNNEYGLSVAWYLFAFTQSAWYETARSIGGLGFAYPGGERYSAMSDLWYEEYYTPDPDGGFYDWPSRLAEPNTNESNEINVFMGDAQTWFTENYMQFLDQSKPLTQENWDTYVTDLYAQGYERYRQIMQNVYDRYMESR